MSSYTSDAEQVENIKRFLSEYGKTILVSIGLAIAISFAWQYWNQHQINKKAQISTSYEAVVANMMNNDIDNTRLQAKYVKEEYPRSPYAVLSALVLARDAINSGKLDEAKAQLQWVMEHSKEPALRQVARLRTARILIAQQEPQEALKLLETVDDNYFMPLIDASRGDAYVTLGQNKSAKAAYSSAIKGMTPADANSLLLSAKLQNIP